MENESKYIQMKLARPVSKTNLQSIYRTLYLQKQKSFQETQKTGDANSIVVPIPK